MRGFLELYSTYQLEYDYFIYKNQTTFSYFIVLTILGFKNFFRKNLRLKLKI